MKVCAIAFDAEWKNPKANSAKKEQHIQKALDLYPETQTILFPETSFTGLVLDEEINNLAEERNGFCVSETRRLARKYKVNLISGFIEKGPNKRPRNALCVVDRQGNLKAVYHKNHLFTLSAEPQVFDRGDGLVVCELDGWRCGFFICFDIRFPRLFEAYKKAGVECLFGALNWLQGRNKPDLFDTLVKARAHENRLFIVAVDRSGKDPKFVYTEKCCIANPYGESCISNSQHPYYYAELQKADVETVNKMFPLMDSFRPEYSVQSE